MKRNITHTLRSGLALILSALLLTSAMPYAAADFEPRIGTDYYVDSGAADAAGDGKSPETAFQTLDQVNAVTYMPGDVIHFKANGVWEGQFAPLGSGSPEAPIVVRQYGEGSRPLLNGAGGQGFARTADKTVTSAQQKQDFFLHATVYLQDQEYWELNDLEITNFDSAAQSGYSEEYLQGVAVEAGPDFINPNSDARDGNTLNHIYLNNLYIHDVNGAYPNQAGGHAPVKDTGGIIMCVTADDSYLSVQDKTIKPTKFNDIRVTNCVIEDVSRSAMNIGNTLWRNDPEKDLAAEYGLYDYQPGGIQNMNKGYGEWYGHTNVYLAHNTVRDIAGDGIVPSFCVAPLVEYNTADNCNSGRSGVYNVGIWPWLCTDAVFQFNEAYNTKTTADGQGFDADGGYRTVFQYNYSHDNEGGFMIMIGDGSVPCFAPVIRYNISQNDRNYVFTHQRGLEAQVYNNTIYNDVGSVKVQYGGQYGTGTYYNNIFYAGPNGNFTDWNASSKHTITYDHNLYYKEGGTLSGLPADVNGLKNVDPRLENPGAGPTGIISDDTYVMDPTKLNCYRLELGSPAINAGRGPVESLYAPQLPEGSASGVDFFGNTLYNGAPDIGAHEFTDVVYGGSVDKSMAWNRLDTAIRDGRHLLALPELAWTLAERLSLESLLAAAESVLNGIDAADEALDVQTGAVRGAVNAKLGASTPGIEEVYTQNMAATPNTIQSQGGTSTVTTVKTTAAPPAMEGQVLKIKPSSTGDYRIKLTSGLDSLADGAYEITFMTQDFTIANGGRASIGFLARYQDEGNYAGLSIDDGSKKFQVHASKDNTVINENTGRDNIELKASLTPQMKDNVLYTLRLEYVGRNVTVKLKEAGAQEFTDYGTKEISATQKLGAGTLAIRTNNLLGTLYIGSVKQFSYDAGSGAFVPAKTLDFASAESAPTYEVRLNRATALTNGNASLTLHRFSAPDEAYVPGFVAGTATRAAAGAADVFLDTASPSVAQGVYSVKVNGTQSGQYGLVFRYADADNYAAVEYTAGGWIAGGKVAGAPVSIDLSSLGIPVPEAGAAYSMMLTAADSHTLNINGADYTLGALAGIYTGAGKAGVIARAANTLYLSPVRVSYVPTGAQTPVIGGQPTDAAVEIGDTVALSVSAAVADGGVLSYQWFGSDDGETDWTLIADAAQAEFTAPTDTVGTCYYAVTVTNTNPGAAGRKTAVAVSNVVSITVADGEVVDALPPVIVTAPVDVSVKQGTPAALSVTASVADGGTLRYQWSWRHVDDSDWELLDGAVGESLSVPTDTVGILQYIVTVTNTNPAATGQTTAVTRSPVVAVTVTPDEPDADTAAIAAAKTAVESAAYTAVQADVGNEAAALGRIQTAIGALALGGVSTEIVKVAYTPPVAGTASHVNGTNGIYTFTVKLTKGAAAPVMTAELTLTITATPYTGSSGGDVGGGTATPPAVTTNPDGSTTTVTKNPDGSTTSVTESVDGGKTTVTTTKSGTTITASVPSGTGTPSGVTAAVKSVVKDGTASAELPVADADALLKAVKDSGAKSITIVPQIEAAADVVSTTMSIPATVAARLGDAADLSVNTPVGSVRLPAPALKELSSGAVGVTLSAGENSTYTLELKSGNETIAAVSGGVRVNLPAANAGAGTVAVLILADGTEQVLPKSMSDGAGVSVLLEGSASVRLVDNSRRFDDIPEGSWCADAIAFASGHGLFQGVSGESFAPDASMSRGMLVTVLSRLESGAVGSKPAGYGDVDSGAYYAGAVAWASENGIVTGTGSGFDPDGGLTRESLAVMLYRYAGVLGLDTGAKAAVSDHAVSAWAADAMSWAVESGLLKGDEKGNLNPVKPATRAETAAILQRFVGLLVK